MQIGSLISQRLATYSSCPPAWFHPKRQLQPHTRKTNNQKKAKMQIESSTSQRSATYYNYP
jgi:hypothetical protein